MKVLAPLENCPILKRKTDQKMRPAYCMDGCSHRDECAFYAPRFYLEHPKAVDDGLVYAVTDHSRFRTCSGGTEKRALRQMRILLRQYGCGSSKCRHPV